MKTGKEGFKVYPAFTYFGLDSQFVPVGGIAPVFGVYIADIFSENVQSVCRISFPVQDQVGGI